MDQKLSKRLKNCPPFYPTGWIPILESNQLNNGTNKLIYFDRNNIIITRDEFGFVSASDANCEWCGINIYHIGSTNQQKGCYCSQKSKGLRGRVKPRICMDSYGFIYFWHCKSGNEAPKPFKDSIQINDEQDFIWISSVKFEMKNSHIQVCCLVSIISFNNEIGKEILLNYVYGRKG